jgi:hypothetical protein
MLTALPALAVSTIFLAWRTILYERQRRERLLCERLAYMLWVAAHHDDDESDEDDGSGRTPVGRR